MALFSALNSISNPVLYYLVIGVVVVNGLVILLLIQVISYRIYSDYQIKANKFARQIWHPVLAEMMLSYPDNIPSLQKKHWHVFIFEWNRFYVMLRGEVRARLQQLSRQKRLDLIACQYINSRNIGNKLLGIVTLGHMQDYSIWNELIDFVNSEHPMLSLTAAQALVDIDSKNAIQFLVPHIIKRKDWPAARVAMLLNSANHEKLSKTLERVIAEAHEEDIPHVLRFLGSNYFDPDINKLCARVGNSRDNRVIAACINTAKGANGLVLARKHVDNPEWYIRLNVARALGRMGEKEDIKILIKLMSDPEWWVRYRSAQSIAQMPFINIGDLKELHRQLDDRFARDILQQVISEQEWH